MVRLALSRLPRLAPIFRQTDNSDAQDGQSATNGGYGKTNAGSALEAGSSERTVAHEDTFDAAGSP